MLKAEPPGLVAAAPQNVSVTLLIASTGDTVPEPSDGTVLSAPARANESLVLSGEYDGKVSAAPVVRRAGVTVVPLELTSARPVFAAPACEKATFVLLGEVVAALQGVAATQAFAPP